MILNSTLKITTQLIKFYNLFIRKVSDLVQIVSFLLQIGQMIPSLFEHIQI